VKTCNARAMEAACLCLMLLPGLVLPAGEGAGARLFVYPYRDDFGQVANWSFVQGTWRCHDGLINGSGQDAKALAGDVGWKDVNITGRFRIVSGNTAAIMFRSTGVAYEEDTGRSFQVENSVTAGVSVSHTSLGSKTTDATAAFKMDRGVWYFFRLLANGTRVDYFINGSPVINFTNVVYAEGQVGLKALRSTCHFDDLEVRDLDGSETLFSDAFQNDQNNGWDPLEGTWSLGGGSCTVVTGSSRDRAICPAPAPGLCWTARTQLMWTAGTAFETGLLFGYDDPENNYLFHLSAADGTLRVRRTEGGSVAEKWASRSFPVRKGEWYTFTVVSNETGFCFYVNSALVLNKTDPSPLPGTGLGLGTRSASQERCRFDYFEVLEGELPPRPDLSVNLSALYIDPARPNPGDAVDIRVGIDNLGTLDAPASYSAELLCGELALEVLFPAAVPAGKGIDIWFHWTANLTGNRSFTVSLDRGGSLLELDDRNNEASFELYLNIPPEAVMALDPPDGRPFVEQAVLFNASASSDPDGFVASYLWSFGDGTHASTAAASHVYKTARAYTVSLNVTDQDGAWTRVSRTLQVRNRVPSAEISWTPAGGNINTDFTFRYTLHDPDRTMSGYIWDFGDGSNTTDQAPTHRFADDGTYNITFTVLYDSGRERTGVSALLTVDNLPPAVTILAAPAELRKGQEGTFRGCATDPDDLVSVPSLSWDFGDGTNASGPEASHNFSRSGTYRVALTATDEHGLNATAFTFVKVANLAPQALFAAPPPAYLNETFRFDGSFSTDGDGPVVSYHWDFGDGTNATGAVATHDFALAGNYTVRLTVFDEEGASGTEEAVVWVREPPLPPRPVGPDEAPSSLPAIGIVVVAAFVVVLGLFAWSRLRRGEGGGPQPPGDELGAGGFRM